MMAKSQEHKRLFAAGRLGPLTHCTQGRHIGFPTDVDRYANAGGIWRGISTCSCCGSTVRADQYVTDAQVAS